MVNTFLIKY